MCDGDAPARRLVRAPSHVFSFFLFLTKKEGGNGGNVSSKQTLFLSPFASGRRERRSVPTNDGDGNNTVLCVIDGRAQSPCEPPPRRCCVSDPKKIPSHGSTSLYTKEAQRKTGEGHGRARPTFFIHLFLFAWGARGGRFGKDNWRRHRVFAFPLLPSTHHDGPVWCSFPALKLSAPSSA